MENLSAGQLVYDFSNDEEVTDYSDICANTGVTNGNSHKCRLAGCSGIRIHVKWKDGKWTYPCSKGMTYRVTPFNVPSVKMKLIGGCWIIGVLPSTHSEGLPSNGEIRVEVNQNCPICGEDNIVDVIAKTEEMEVWTECEHLYGVQVEGRLSKEPTAKLQFVDWHMVRDATPKESDGEPLQMPCNWSADDLSGCLIDEMKLPFETVMKLMQDRDFVSASLGQFQENLASNGQWINDMADAVKQKMGEFGYDN
ncbi:MAG: hypothetical protein ACW99G_11635 [Candidatus Thorarchaeota archaeon]|jgi:hypothetical protein